MSDLTDLIFGEEYSYPIETIEIKHSLWPIALRYLVNVDATLMLKHDGMYHEYTYMPLKIQKGAASTDLDQKVSITVGDLGQVVPDLIDLILDAESLESPSFIYRMYMSTNLDAPIQTISNLHIVDGSTSDEGSTFQAEAQKLNVTGTGLIFEKDYFPSLIGFY